MVNLEHAEVTEKGTHFKTGESLVLPVTHRRQKTQRFGARYGQDIEPVGRYVLHGHLGTSGTQDEGGGHKVTTVHDMVHFRNPLVIRHGGTGSEPGMWKRRLSDHYGGKTGRALSRALAKAGFDAVVTVDSYTRQGKTTFYTSEIVDLTNLRRNPFKSQAQRRLFYAKARRGEISPKVVREWERETGKRKLPERANSRRANGYQAEDTALSPKEREVIRVVEKALPDCKDSCWIATEVIYHLLDGKRDGYEALEVLHEGSRHWFLRTPRGGIIDVTAQQFDDENIPYEEGRPRPGLSPATLTQSAHADDLIASNRALKSLWYEKEDADWRRRQKERKLPERANPSHGPSRKALKRYEATHWGIESDRTIRVNDADLPRELVEMGKLKELGVTPEDATKPYALDFPNYEKTSLSFSQGKDQRLYNVVPPDVQRALKRDFWKAGEPTVRLGEVNKLTGGRQDKFRCPTIQVQVLGRCNYVIYQTRKLDDFKKDGQASNYIHEFGEESGILPYLCIANDGTLWFAGGNYTILDGGIAD